jgi:inhibitor of KinA sporulation pathway (predicted exonuclease)
MAKSLIIFDVEATCDINIPKQKRELIEIGAVKIENGNIVDRFQKLIKPKKNSILSNYCKELTHISQEEIDFADTPLNVLQSFLEWSRNSVLGSWGDFDPDIIKRELHKNKIILPNDISFINIKKVYLSIKHFPSTYSLQDSLKKEKIVFNGTQHRAYDDAYNTYLIYQKNKQQMNDMIKKLYSQSFSIA